VASNEHWRCTAGLFSKPPGHPLPFITVATDIPYVPPLGNRADAPYIPPALGDRGKKADDGQSWGQLSDRGQLRGANSAVQAKYCLWFSRFSRHGARIQDENKRLECLLDQRCTIYKSPDFRTIESADCPSVGPGASHSMNSEIERIRAELGPNLAEGAIVLLPEPKKEQDPVKTPPTKESLLSGRKQAPDAKAAT
jgi:hypothetical protein